MIYNLYILLEQWLETHGLGFFRVFSFITFRAVIAIIISFLMVMAAAKPTIRWLLRQKIGDNPEFHHQDLYQIMEGSPSGARSVIIQSVASRGYLAFWKRAGPAHVQSVRCGMPALGTGMGSPSIAA